MYYKRLIDRSLAEWAAKDSHKPLLLRGARQVGKSTAVRHLGEQFANYVEINFERQPNYKQLFATDLDVKRIVSQMQALCGQRIKEGETLLFLDEIQQCTEAIMSLRFFKEDLPGLHVVAAGSLLEFALDQLPTFGVGRIHSMFMHPMTFDEFLWANGEDLLMQERDRATPQSPLNEQLHQKLVSLLRIYMLTGGMPEVVAKWVETHDFIQCQEIQDDIIVSYEDDFPKYRKRIDPMALRLTMRNIAVQAAQKFVYANATGCDVRDVRNAVEMLILAGIVIPVTHSDANGLPLGAEANRSYRKLLIIDTGLMLRLLNMSLGDVSEITSQILTATAADLVNKGSMAELLAGLELQRVQPSNMRNELYYWQRQAKNSLAEIDYILPYRQSVLPIEVKAGVRGGMKSLWLFMREKQLSRAVRCSLENFGEFTYIDVADNDAPRNVTICPLYAVSQMARVASSPN